MCDTLWISKNNVSFFGKNSDRAANEPNLVLYVPSKTHQKSAKVKCTYVEIPQVEQTHAVLLVKPSWMFGAEMGVNQFGVYAGNEAVFTKSKGKKDKKLLGMDILRLALERSQTARQAVEVVVELLDQFGQGGNCGFDKQFFYDNSFLFADSVSCFVVETSGKQYVVRQEKTQANISNRLNIGSQFDFGNATKGVDFAKKHREPVYSFFSGSEQRRSFIENRLKALNSPTATDIFGILRGHHKTKGLYSKGSVKSVCMHAGGIGDHTTGSMVSEIRTDQPSTIWLNGSSTPCISVFKPCFFAINTPPIFENQQNSLEFWLFREYFNRGYFLGLVDREEFLHKARQLENSFVEEEKQLFSQKNVSDKQLREFSSHCAEKEQQLYQHYANVVEKIKTGEAKLTGFWGKKTKMLAKNNVLRGE